MSYHVEFHARSRAHANRLLELYKTQLPAPVHAFIQASIDGIQPLKEGASRVLHVKASGHLCNSDGSFAASTATIAVTPIDIPD
jgi:hypothetical protein